MHYIVHVIHPADADLDQIMEPFNYENSHQGSLQWDWWVVGGRWDNYFGPILGNSVTVPLALIDLTGRDGELGNGPYAYITADGQAVCMELYNPGGSGYDRDDPNSVHPANPAYAYRAYLESVQDRADLRVTAIDIHE